MASGEKFTINTSLILSVKLLKHELYKTQLWLSVTTALSVRRQGFSSSIYFYDAAWLEQNTCQTGRSIIQRVMCRDIPP